MSVLGTDNFNRANETPLAGNWTTITGTTAFNLASNAAAPADTNDDCGSYRNDITPSNDHYSQAKLSTSSTGGGGVGPGVSCRASTSVTTYYRVIADRAAASNVELGKVVSGSGFTSIWVRTQAWNNGDTLRLEVQGTTLRVYLNGVQIGADSTDSGITSGRFGIAYSSPATAPTVDDWEGGDFSGGAAQVPYQPNYQMAPILAQ